MGAFYVKEEQLWASHKKLSSCTFPEDKPNNLLNVSIDCKHTGQNG